MPDQLAAGVSGPAKLERPKCPTTTRVLDCALIVGKWPHRLDNWIWQTYEIHVKTIWQER